MGGRLFDWLGAGAAVDRPAAAAMPALLVSSGCTAIYFATDTKIFGIFDESGPSWFEIDAAALAAMSFMTLPDVDNTGLADGNVFKWDAGASKLVPLAILYNTLEAVQDVVGAMVANGTGTTGSYDDGAGTIKWDSTITQYTDEIAQDALAAAFAAGTHTGFTVTYNDAANKFDFAVTVTQYTNEMAMDAIASMIASGSHTGFTATYNDAGDAMSFAVTVTQYTDEMAQDAMAAMTSAGNGIKVTYNDGANTFTIEIGPLTIQSDQTGDYTPVLGDANQIIPMNKATGQNFTLPQNSDVAFPIGTRISYWQKGAGTVTAVAGTGATVNSRGGILTSAGQYAFVTAIKISTNGWLLVGDLA